MENTVNHGSAIVCAENISFLYLLHSVPTLPVRNALETPKTCAQGYVLSLAEKCRLVESLAFLANDSDDVNHIPALCIQQDPAIFSKRSVGSGLRPVTGWGPKPAATQIRVREYLHGISRWWTGRVEASSCTSYFSHDGPDKILSTRDGEECIRRRRLNVHEAHLVEAKTRTQ